MAAKIMLVEDDTNLSDIYKARLEAEGFEIVSAQDGEAALALAVKEKPDLIIADVMMPKISGFDMLDILRSTSGIQDTKVIMMTALSQAEDQDRAKKLGANRYLVKSQVTLEDVVKTVHEVLGDESSIDQTQPAIAEDTQTPAETSPESLPPSTRGEAIQPETTQTPDTIPIATADSQSDIIKDSSQTDPDNEVTTSSSASEQPSISIPVVETPSTSTSDSSTPSQSLDNVVDVPSNDQATPTQPTSNLSVDNSQSASTNSTSSMSSDDTDQSTSDEKTAVLSQIKDFVDQQEAKSSGQTNDSTTKPDDVSQTTNSVSADDNKIPDSKTRKVIQPLSQSEPRLSINELVAKEDSAANSEPVSSVAQPAETPTQAVDNRPDPNSIAL